MSTILDALRRAQKIEDDATGAAPKARPSDEAGRRVHPHEDDSLPEPVAPPPHLVGTGHLATEAIDTAETTATIDAADVVDVANLADAAVRAGRRPQESPASKLRGAAAAVRGRLMALPIPASLRDRGVPAMVVGGLAIGLVLAAMFGADEPEPLELPQAVAEKIAAAGKPAVLEPEPSAEQEAKRAKRQAEGGKPAKTAKPPAAVSVASPKPAPQAAAPLGSATAQPAPNSPPTQGALALGPGALSADPAGAPAPAVLPPTALASAALTTVPTGPVQPAPPDAFAKPTTPPVLPGAATTPPALGPPPAATAVLPAAGPMSPIVPEPAGTPTEVAVAPPAQAEPEGELLDAPPEGAPPIDLLFIRWRRQAAGRVATVRTGGQRIVVLHENDIIEGMKVSRIDQSGIEFQWRGQRFLVFAARY